MVIQQQRKSKILLIGDDCVDEYQFGTVDRISPEAPVPVFRYDHSVCKPGMAGNVNENLQALGCQVSYMHGESSRKTRLIDSRSRQHIVRIDDDLISEPLRFEHISLDLRDADAIVISDYNKGYVTYDLIESLRQNYLGPMFVDTKKTDLARLQGCVVKINSTEYDLLKTECSDLVITLGAGGARYQGRVYPAKTIEVVDVCGAGDTFLAAMAHEYLQTHSMEAAIEFAIRASAVTVQHNGVYAPTLEEIQ